MSIHTQIELPEWLLLHGSIIGAEGESEGEASTGTEGQSSEEVDDDLTPEAKDLPDDHPVKKALREERKLHRQAETARKTAEREAARLHQAEEDRKLAEAGELEREKTLRERAEERNAKLAQGFLRSNIDRAIEKAAQEAKFIDPDDALQGVDRQKITYEQDAEDPTVVTVDLKSVKAAVTDLATRKKHLVRASTEDGEPTGSPFGGGTTRKKTTDEDTLREQYPSLR